MIGCDIVCDVYCIRKPRAKHQAINYYTTDYDINHEY